LDLFAGTGALGFEAMSRGASKLVSVECDPAALKVLRKNADSFKLDGTMFQIVTEKALRQWPAKLNQLSSHCPFDVVFCDPPYHKNLVSQSLKNLELSPKTLFHAETLLVIEMASDEELPKGLAWEVVFEKRTGSTTLLFCKRVG
jgi:16S rRNA (guanine966-N2)-methyltransferase